MIRVFAKAKSKAGCADLLRPILKRLVRSSRSEDGVLTYELFETVERGEFLFREEYLGPEVFEKHRNARHVRVAVARATPLMDGPLSLWIVEPVLDVELRT